MTAPKWAPSYSWPAAGQAVQYVSRRASQRAEWAGPTHFTKRESESKGQKCDSECVMLWRGKNPGAEQQVMAAELRGTADKQECQWPAGAWPVCPQETAPTSPWAHIQH